MHQTNEVGPLLQNREWLRCSYHTTTFIVFWIYTSVKDAAKSNLNFYFIHFFIIFFFLFYRWMDIDYILINTGADSVIEGSTMCKAMLQK